LKVRGERSSISVPSSIKKNGKENLKKRIKLVIFRPRKEFFQGKRKGGKDSVKGGITEENP